MPVDLLQGARHAVIECMIPTFASSLTNFSERPRRIAGGRPLFPVRERSPPWYWKSSICTPFDGGAEASILRASGSPANVPPWLPVLAQVPVRDLPGHVDVRGERIRSRPAGVEGHRHDPHRLVPRGPLGVVRRVHREHVALAHPDAPA